MDRKAAMPPASTTAPAMLPIFLPLPDFGAGAGAPGPGWPGPPN
jgi:hypothetical protein